MSFKILKTEELDTILGKESFWKSKPVIGSLTYLEGISALDIVHEQRKVKASIPITMFIKRPKGIEVKMIVGFGSSLVALLDDQIESVQLEDREQIYEQKEKSVIGRAVVGGLVYGPAGALIGGLSAKGTKTVKADMPELILSIKYGAGETQKMILFSCKYTERASVEKFFTNTMKDKYNKASAI